MNNKNIYKILCTIIITLGLVFSGGKLVYAHNPKLTEAERVAVDNPTPENLGYLYALYKQDVHYHMSRYEYDEAKKSAEGMNKTRRKYAKIMLKDAEKEATKALNKAYRDESPENYKKLIKCYDKLSELYASAGNSASAARAIANASIVRAHRASIIVSNNKTPENYEKAAKLWDAASKYCTVYGKMYVAGCRIEAALAKVKQAKIRVKYDESPENYGKLAQCWDELAELYESLASDTQAMSARNKAAWAKIQQLISIE